MDVNTLLARRAGELVRRLEIQAAVCDSDVHFDHAAAINTAVRETCRALDDDPETPRFIETM
jgi:DNA-binding winged helix-turn-helix (wHTH) protein